jgi:hypothetical protein
MIFIPSEDYLIQIQAMKVYQTTTVDRIADEMELF